MSVRPFDAFSDVEVLELFRHGDKVAYEEIYRRYWSVLYLFCGKVLKDEDEAKDIVQEVFISLLDKGADLQIKVSLSVYLYASARYKVLDRIKHKQVKDNYLISLKDYAETDGIITDAKLIEKEFVFQVEKAIQELPEKMRQVFEMSRNENLSHKEIAKKLNISDKTVKRQVSNAIKILKVKLGDLAVLVLLMKL